jgi:CHAD domain-containing protein
MNREKLFKLWRRQYQRLMQRQRLLIREAHTQGLPEQIHDLRVTLRRLRLMVRVSTPLLDRAAAERYRSWSRKITNASSHLRDFDVTIEWLASQRADSTLTRNLKARRQRLWKMTRNRFVPPPPKVQSGVERLESGKPGRQRLSRRYPKRFARLHARVVAEIPRFFDLDEAERHAFRRTIRLLRYLREFALTRRQQERDPLLKSLIHPQAAMGEYQNILVARQIIGALKSPVPPPALLRALIQEQARWRREIKASLAILTRAYRSRIRTGSLRPTSRKT